MVATPMSACNDVEQFFSDLTLVPATSSQFSVLSFSQVSTSLIYSIFYDLLSAEPIIEGLHCASRVIISAANVYDTHTHD